jgi:hypothetical protein
MSHFSEQVWADFARGLDVHGNQREVSTHLAAGCPECKSTFDLWEQVVRIAKKEDIFAPPESLVRMVKSEFFSPETAEAQDWPLASLLFDSSSAPLRVGMRSGSASTRQFVYEGEGLTVDVRFERQLHSNRISASGQVLDKAVPLRWLGRTAIVLWNDRGQMLAKTEAGDYGEFHFEFEPQEHLRISIATVDRRTLRIALGDMA